jgi:hypothetical protein
MTTTRYTGNRLATDVAQINDSLASIKSSWRLVVGYRYGHTSLDLATIQQAAEHCCQRNLECGTPRECLSKAQSFLAGEALNAALGKDATPV